MVRTGKNRTKQIALLAMFLALSLICSYIETFIPLSFAVPGVKIGLANIPIVFALYRLGERSAAGISLLRVLLSALLFGNMVSLWYSLAGATLSLLCMLLLKRTDRFSPAGVSVCGGVAHNIGQIAVAGLVLRSAGLLYYLPVLILSGLAAGIGVGLVAAFLCTRIPQALTEETHRK